MKIPALFILLSLMLSILDGKPRKVRTLEFPNDPDKAIDVEVNLENDAFSQQEAETKNAIEIESQNGQSLLDTPRSETLTQYLERLEASRKRLKENPADDEALRDKQIEALYEAEYQLRRSTFGGSVSTGLYGHGAGPTGDRYQQSLDLVRVFEMLKGDESREPDVDSDGTNAKPALSADGQPEQVRKEDDTP